MVNRFFVIVSIVTLALLLAASAAMAQTPVPIRSNVICTNATPCADTAVASAGMWLGSMAVEAAASLTEVSDAQEPANAGFGLAWAIMGLLGLALLYAFAAAVLIAAGREAPVFPAGSRVLIPILSVVGLGVALYLTYVETQNVAAVCGPVGDCNAVQASPFAKLFGILPVGLLGALGYVAILVSWFLGRDFAGPFGRLAPLAVFGMALFGVLFSIYLTYLELYIIKAVCIWCLTSATIMSLVSALSVGPARDALQEE